MSKPDANAEAPGGRESMGDPGTGTSSPQATGAGGPGTGTRPSPPQATDLGAPELVEALVRRAETAGASDIHLHRRGEVAEVAFRLDGVLTPVDTLGADIAERAFGRIKFLARLKTYQDALPQDGRIDQGALGCGSDIRVATFPTVTGEKIVLRLFRPGGVKGLRELCFPPEVVGEVERFLSQTAGLMLLTGPAGSGKTTTIYACLKELGGRGGRHVITVEDPAEQIIQGIMQTEVNEGRGLTFAVAARHLLRQDPQVLVIGEIRDEETANIVVRAALTGHQVISTIHAGSCRGVLERLLVLCQDHSAVASSLALVLNQRLVRRFCAPCAGKGCNQCLKTGYHGRLPIVEVLAVTPPVRRRVAARDVEGVQPPASLDDAARQLLKANLTSLEEIERVLGHLPA